PPRATPTARQTGRSRNIRLLALVRYAIARSFLRRLRFGWRFVFSRFRFRGFYLGRFILGWFLQIGAMLWRYIDNRRVLTSLERAQISDDRPAVGHHDVRSVCHHRVLTVRDRVENFAVGHFPNAI